MDVINLISKDQRFPDADVVLGPDAKFQPGSKYYVNGPRMHEFLQEMNRKVLSKYDGITVGEMPGVSDINEVMRSVGSKAGELNMIFIFDIVDVDNEPGKVRFTLWPWTVKDVRRILNKWQRAMIEHDGWNTVFLENHDNPRSVSRYCDDSDQWREYGAKMLALMQTTLAGTLYVYQGEELGMRNMPKSWDIDENYKDVEAINFWKASKRKYANDPDSLAKARVILERKARDHSRTPVQWNAGPNAGFCDEGVKPWMRVNDDYKEVNAEKEMADEGEGEDLMSVFHFWKRGMANRKVHKDVFVYGDFHVIGPDSEHIFAYVRVGEKAGKWLVVLNFTGGEAKWPIPQDLKVEGWMAGNYTNGKPDKELSGSIVLRPWEGILGKCKDEKNQESVQEIS